MQPTCPSRATKQKPSQLVIRSVLSTCSRVLDSYTCTKGAVVTKYLLGFGRNNQLNGSDALVLTKFRNSGFVVQTIVSADYCVLVGTLA